MRLVETMRQKQKTAEEEDKRHSRSRKYEKTGDPTISIDTKKKEAIGNLYRNEAVYCIEPVT